MLRDIVVIPIRYCIYFVHLLAVTVRRSIASYNRDFLAISGDYRRWREPANCEAPVIALVDISASKLDRYYTHSRTYKDTRYIEEARDNLFF